MANIVGTSVISALIGRQILSQAISDASYTIYGSISDIYYYSSKVDRVLIALDVKQKIKIVEDVCKILQNKEKNIDLISNSLESIHDMIINIREDLKNINIKIGKHKDKWFNRWRSIDVRTELVNLKLHCDVLDKRFNLMTKSIKIV
jgi:hypothetical protein